METEEDEEPAAIAPPKAVLSRPFVGEPGSVCTETYLVASARSSRKVEAEMFAPTSPCTLDALSHHPLQKPSQNTTKNVYTFVPDCTI